MSSPEKGLDTAKSACVLGELEAELFTFLNLGYICLCLGNFLGNFVGNFVTQIIFGLNLGHTALLQRGRLLLPFNTLLKNRITISQAYRQSRGKSK